MVSVLHLCESDGGGGAMQAAHRLHRSLLRVDVQSKMLVAWKTTNDPSVAQIELCPSLGARIGRRVKRFRNQRRRASYDASGIPGAQHFSFSAGHLGADLCSQLPEADILNLHWFDALVDLEGLVQNVGSGQGIVWRLADMNAMTGGCHYSAGCERFTNSCGACPQLSSGRENDVSRRTMLRKRRALERLAQEKVRIVAPSKWIGLEARRSSLLSRFEIRHIPTGVDCETFQPRDQEFARHLFDLPVSGKIVLFAADHVSSARKGFDLLSAAVADLPVGAQAQLVKFGSGGNAVFPGIDLTGLGRIERKTLMSYAYSAADVVVIPSRSENFPNIALEAMACGVPCIGFNVGGIPDLVRHEETGLLVAPEDVVGLRIAIERVLTDWELRSYFSESARSMIESEFPDTLMAARYKALYEELIAARPGSRAAAAG